MATVSKRWQGVYGNSDFVSAGGASTSKKSSKKEKTSDQIDNIPLFYKIILKEESEKRIPPPFLKHISKDLTDTATLRVVSGGSWNVKLDIKRSDVFMQDGWQEFVRDNSLLNYEFLVFKYDGNMCFNVTIFDPNGVERTGTSDIRMHQESVGFSNGKRPRGRPKQNPVDNLNHHPLLKSCGQGSASRGLACHKSKKLETIEKRKECEQQIKKLKTTKKGKNLNPDRIQSSSKLALAKRTTLNASGKKKK